MEYEYLGSSIFDWIHRKTFLGNNFLTRGVFALAEQWGWQYLNYSFFVANHELGHGTRLLSLGGYPGFGWDGESTHISIFTFILAGYSKYGGRAYTALSAVSNLQMDENQRITVSAGGMNNSMLFGEALEDEVYDNSGHVAQLVAYIRAKLDANGYARGTANGSITSGDVTSLLSLWQNKGYSISATDVANGGLNAFYGSFTTYAYLWSLLRYIGVGDPQVNAFHVGRLKLPDLSFYQNADGLSYRVRSAVDFGNTVIPFSVEYLYKGTPAVELSLGAHFVNRIAGVRKTGSLIQAFLSTAGGIGVRAARDFQTGASSFASLEAALFTANSLEGARNVSFPVGSTLGAEVSLRWSKVY